MGAALAIASTSVYVRPGLETITAVAIRIALGFVFTSLCGGGYMPGKNVVILDGTGAADQDLSPILDMLSRVFKAAEAKS